MRHVSIISPTWGLAHLLIHKQRFHIFSLPFFNERTTWQSLSIEFRVLWWRWTLILPVSKVPRMRIIWTQWEPFQPWSGRKSSAIVLFHCVHSAARQLSKLYCKHCVGLFSLGIMPLCTASACNAQWQLIRSLCHWLKAYVDKESPPTKCHHDLVV